MPKTGTGPEGNYVSLGNSINVGGDRNWRNNNPGNIEAGTFADSEGAIGSDGRFAIFPDPETGMQALRDLLSSDTYQSLTVEEAMERYAPSEENNTDAYTSFITNTVGVDPSTQMSDLSNDQLESFASAIETFEGGTAGTTYEAGDPNLPSWTQGAFASSEADDQGSDAGSDTSGSEDGTEQSVGPEPTPTPGPTPDMTSDSQDQNPEGDGFPNPTPNPSPGSDPSAANASGSAGDTEGADGSNRLGGGGESGSRGGGDGGGVEGGGGGAGEGGGEGGEGGGGGGGGGEGGGDGEGGGGGGGEGGGGD